MHRGHRKLLSLVGLASGLVVARPEKYRPHMGIILLERLDEAVVLLGHLGQKLTRIVRTEIGATN
ncbi:MAG TPA: hypothetical protein VJJ24_02910 [Candidatus Paceibacterota bacterium]